MPEQPNAANGAREAAQAPGGLTFEQAYAELEKTVAALQQGQLPLEETLRLYERGTELARYCREQLAAVELKVSRLVAQGDGSFAAKPLQAANQQAEAPADAKPNPAPAPAAREAETPEERLAREQRELFD